ncbi:MAG: TRAM domain-containing protein, partial [Thermoleophilia bacterium]|nr:TRAM domain-containing protein [Thermoleophilia bacterium]
MSTVTNPLRRGQLVELTVTDLAFGGKGLGRIDNVVVFVPGAIPGDQVKAEITRAKKRYAEACLVELLRPSEH